MKRKLYKICVLKLVVGCLVLSYSLAYGADPKAEQNNQKPVPVGDVGKRTPSTHVAPKMPMISFSSDIPGVVLFFHHPPNEEETTLIMKYTTEHGLKKVSAWSLSIMWTFEWDKPQNTGFAMRICKDVPKPPSLEACRLNWPVVLNSVSADQPPPIQYNKDLCGLAKDHQTYWAQNIIGADLLREELKKKSRK